MPNIQVIDGAENCTYDIYAVKDDSFFLIYPEEGQDVEFAEDFIARVGDEVAALVLEEIWKNRLDKKEAEGIHGTLFFELTAKKPFYPTKKESEMAIVL